MHDDIRQQEPSPSPGDMTPAPLVRAATSDDEPALLRLDEACWPAPLRGFDKAEIAQRVRAFPEGQFVAVDSTGQVVGSLWTQRIASADMLLRTGAKVNVRNAIALHQEQGAVWQCGVCRELVTSWITILTKRTACVLLARSQCPSLALPQRPQARSRAPVGVMPLRPT